MFNKKPNDRILGMTHRELLIFGSVGVLLLFVIIFLGGYIFNEINRSDQGAVLPLKSTPELLLQSTNLPLAVKPSDTPIPQPTFTISPTNTSTLTETPMGPVSFTYEGVTLYCTCTDCICLTNQLFTIRLTIDAQGNVTGTFEKYLPDYPAIELVGVTNNITGSVQNDKKEGNSMDFKGSLSKNYKTLNATLSFQGSDGTGKRELLFSIK